MKKMFTIVFLLAFIASYANSFEAEKECFGMDNPSFARKTKDEIVLYGDKKNPKVALVKYEVKNNPRMQDGYPDQSFYMIDLPKVVKKVFSIESWNDYLCGKFFPYAYPNVNEITSVKMKGGRASVTDREKSYYFRTMDFGLGLDTPEAIDSFSISIPGNLIYNNYPVSKVYPNDFVKRISANLFQEKKGYAEMADELIEVFAKNDFEARKDYIEELKNKKSSIVATAEIISDAIDNFDDMKNVDEHTDVYNMVKSYLKQMNDKFDRVRPFMTPNSSAFADAVQLFYQEFEKQSNRYLKKIKTKKNKETEQHLADYSKESLENAIAMIQRGVHGLGLSSNESDRQIAYILNDYEAKFTELLESIDSGNCGSARVANPAISSCLNDFGLMFDLLGIKKVVYANKGANEAGVNVIELDDGNVLALYGEVKDGKDNRILIKTKSSSISSLFFDDLGNFLGSFIDGERFLRNNYLPPMQVVYAGNGHVLKLYGDEANMLNESFFPENKLFLSATGIAYREKLACVFEAVQGDMKKYKEIVGTETMNTGSLSFVKKNEKFHSLSCSEGVISLPKKRK